MREQDANTAQFLFTCNAVTTETFEVASFKGTDSISNLYVFEIELRSENNSISIKDIAGSTASLFIYRNNQFFPYSGIISKFTFKEKTTDYCIYEAILVPRLWLLNLTDRCKIYQKMTVTDIIKEILDESGLSSYYSFYCGTYPQREFVMQYEESNFNFISRLMEEYGIWYFFNEGPISQNGINSCSTEQLLITDKPSSFQNIPSPTDIKFRSKSQLVEIDDNQFNESIRRITLEKSMISSKVNLKNYNYRTPEVDISGTQVVKEGTNGIHTKFGGPWKNIDEISKTLKVEHDRLVTSHTLAAGTGDCRAIRAGSKFQLIDAPRSDLEDLFLITRVCHKGEIIKSTDRGSLHKTYSNTFNALPSDYANTYRPLIKTPKPRINGIVTAMIEGRDSEYSYLDDKGRYKIRVPFDSAQTDNADGSKYIRMAQPYSGTNYGIHFPSHEGTEMILGCIQGDPDKPVGLGTIPNANTISPVKSQNKHQSIIRTAGGNEIILDDLDQKQKISIKTNANNNQLFDDENKKIVIQSTDDNKIVIDDQNKKIIINAAQNTFTLDYNDNGSKITLTTTDGHGFTLDDDNKCIQIQSAGGQSVKIDDDSEVMTLSDDDGVNTVTLDRNAGISLESQEDITIRSDGDFNIEAANIAMQSSGNIESSADSDVSIQGTNVDINADANASINGATRLEATGGNATFEASGMGEVKARGVMAVQGSVVNIN